MKVVKLEMIKFSVTYDDGREKNIFAVCVSHAILEAGENWKTIKFERTEETETVHRDDLSRILPIGYQASGGY